MNLTRKQLDKIYLDRGLPLPVIDLPAARSSARGTHRRGEMNKTETLYAQYLELLKNAGLVREYWFEPFTMQLGPEGQIEETEAAGTQERKSCTYTPDFMVLLRDWTVCFDEVKPGTVLKSGRTGPYCQEDARVKIKTAARLYPLFVFRIVFPEASGEWNVRIL